MGKTRPVREYKHDDYTRNGDSSQGEMEELTKSRGKRIRKLLYSPENENSSENSVLHPESPQFPPFDEDNSSSKPNVAAEQTSSKSTKCDSSASNSEGASIDQVPQSSGRKQSNLHAHNDKQRFNVDIKDRKETGAYLDLEVEKLPLSALVDVDLTVQTSFRAESVPFVCLKSESYGKAVTGYPLDIGKITDVGSEILLSSNESVACKLFGDKGSRFHQLVWRTSKRTPVCYVTNSLSSAISKNVKAKQASEGIQESNLPARENGVLLKDKTVTEFQKNSKQFNRGKQH